MPLLLVLLFILILNGFLECVTRTIPLLSAIRKRNIPARDSINDREKSSFDNMFVSAHIATYNEPPDLVIATLRAIASSSFCNYEVIVIDNNTVDPAIWRPVEAEIRELGPRFRFRHFDILPGAKAGALNAALGMMDAQATHVAVIDADYQVFPTFFAEALEAVVSSDVDYVQFPQAYRGVSACGRGVEQELGDYFACFARGAGRPGSMLPTGTLSLFSAPALRAVGGWDACTITEDAELGVRLQAAGYRGLWISELAGHGLLPMDFRGLAKQRARWAAGNMQVLRQVVRKRGTSLGYLDFFNLIAQLSAWISFWGLPAAALAMVALFPSLPLSGPLGVVAAGTIVVSSVLTAIRMSMLVKRQEGRWRIQLSALEAKLALTWVSAFAWLPALVNFPLRFHRTPKTKSADAGSRLTGMLIASMFFGAFAIIFLLSGRVIEVVACALLSTIWVCARSTDRSLRVTAKLNARNA